MKLSNQKNKNQHSQNKPYQQLNQAIEQMKDLLGEDEQNQDQEDENYQLQQQITNPGDLESYVQILDQRYDKVIQMLQQEEVDLRESQQINRNLKKQLGDIISDSRYYTQQKNQELLQLQSNYQQMLQDNNVKNRDIHYKKMEIQQLDEIYQEKEAIVTEAMKKLLQLKNSNDQILEPFESYKEQINIEKNLLNDEQQKLQVLNQQYEEGVELYNQLKKEFQNLNYKNRQIQQQINTNYAKDMNNNIGIDKLNTQQSLALAQHSKALKNFENQQNIIQKLEDELQDKNQKLDETRQFNNAYQKIGENFEMFESHLNYEESRHITLRTQNEVLKKELDQYLYLNNRTGLNESTMQHKYDNIDIKTPQNQTPIKQNASQSGYQSETRKIFKQNQSNVQFITPEIQNEIKRLLDLHQNQSPQEIKVLEQKLQKDNKIIEIEVQEVNEKIAQRMGVLDSQYDAINKLQNEVSELKEQIQLIDFEQQEYLQNQEQIESQMDSLNSKFQGISKSLGHHSNSKMNDEKLPYYQVPKDPNKQNSKIFVQISNQDENSISQRSGKSEISEQKQRNHNQYKETQKNLAKQFYDQINDDDLDNILNSKPQALSARSQKSYEGEINQQNNSLQSENY